MPPPTASTSPHASGAETRDPSTRSTRTQTESAATLPHLKRDSTLRRRRNPDPQIHPDRIDGALTVPPPHSSLSGPANTPRRCVDRRLLEESPPRPRTRAPTSSARSAARPRRSTAPRRPGLALPVLLPVVADQSEPPWA